MARLDLTPAAGETARTETRDAIAYRRIVVPLDGSAVAEQALPYAEVMAQLTGAPLYLVRVLVPNRQGTFDSTLAMEQWLAAERKSARRHLGRIEHGLRNRHYRVTGEFRLGPAVQELLAATQPGDLLVMATHGRGGFGRWFLGSVASGVLPRATVPVLLVRASKTTPGPASICRLLVPLDGSALAEEALPAALELARGLSVPIHLVTAIDVSGTMPRHLATGAVRANRLAERRFTDAQNYLAQSRERLGRAGVVTSMAVGHGAAGRVIVAAAQPGDLIVMTSHGRTGPARWLLGSVAEAVARRAPVPVLLLRSTPAAGDSSPAT